MKNHIQKSKNPHIDVDGFALLLCHGSCWMPWIFGISSSIGDTFKSTILGYREAH